MESTYRQMGKDDEELVQIDFESSLEFNISDEEEHLLLKQQEAGGVDWWASNSGPTAVQLAPAAAHPASATSAA